MAARRILLLTDGSSEIAVLTQKLAESGFDTQTCEIASDIVAQIDQGSWDLLIAATDYSVAIDLAEKIHDKWKAPTFCVLATAGDETRASLRKHPAIIGVFYRPLNVEKVVVRASQLFT